jgi:hypothetical protein
MNPKDLATDGAVIVATFVAPSRGLSAAVARRRSLSALLLATLAALAFAAAAVSRVDYERAAAVRLEAVTEPGEKAAELTPHEREKALATARKLGQVAGWAGAALGPALAATAAAAFLWLGFRLAGTRPAFRDTFAGTTHGLLPVSLAKALSIPAAVARAPIPAEEVGLLLPSSAAALLPPGAPAALGGVLGALDLFALWSVALVAIAMARASGASRRRAAVVTAILYAAYVAVIEVALPAVAGAAGGGR